MTQSSNPATSSVSSSGSAAADVSGTAAPLSFTAPSSGAAATVDQRLNHITYRTPGASLVGFYQPASSVFPDCKRLRTTLINTTESSSVSPPSSATVSDFCRSLSDDKSSQMTAHHGQASPMTLPTTIPNPSPVVYPMTVRMPSFPMSNIGRGQPTPGFSIGLGKMLQEQCVSQSTSDHAVSSPATDSSSASSVSRAEGTQLAAPAAATLIAPSSQVPMLCIQFPNQTAHFSQVAAFQRGNTTLALPTMSTGTACSLQYGSTLQSRPAEVVSIRPNVYSGNDTTLPQITPPPPPSFIPAPGPPSKNKSDHKSKSKHKRSKKERKHSKLDEVSSNRNSKNRKKKSSHSSVAAAAAAAKDSSSSSVSVAVSAAQTKKSSSKHGNKKRHKSKKPNMKQSKSMKASSKGLFTDEMRQPTKFDNNGSAIVNVKLSRKLGYEDLASNDYTPLKVRDASRKYGSDDADDAALAADCLKSIRRRVKEESHCNCHLHINENGMRKLCGLTDVCENRICKLECPEDCPNGKFCQNQRIRRRQWQPTFVSTTPDKGRGLFAARMIRKNSLVIEYLGEVITEKEGKFRRLKDHDRYGGHFYMLQLERGLLVDATLKGSPARFMNHSCSPNCITRKWNVSGEVRIGLYALRDIPYGEELTFDYQFESFGEEEAHPCHCGAVNCRKFLGARPIKEAAVDTSERRFVSVRHRKIVIPKIRNETVAELLRKKQTKDLINMLESDQSVSTQMIAFADCVSEESVSRKSGLCKDQLIRGLRLRCKLLGRSPTEILNRMNNLTVKPSDSSVSSSSSAFISQSSSDIPTPMSSSSSNSSCSPRKSRGGKRKRKEMNETSRSECRSLKHSSADVQSVSLTKPKKKKRRPKVSNPQLLNGFQSCSSVSPALLVDSPSKSENDQKKAPWRLGKRRCYSDIVKDKKKLAE